MKKLLFALMALALGMTACQDKNKPEEPKPEEVTYKLTITPSELSLYADESATLKLTLTPEAQKVEYKFTTDDEDIATVNSKGHVTAGSKYGEATITVRASIDGEEVARARCHVEVVKDKVILSEEEVTLAEGKSTTLTAKLNKAGTTVTSSCTWKSSDTKVATVSGGTIYAVAEGECDITATYDGVNAVCHVTVLPKLTISITPANAQILVGETAQVTTNIPGSTYSSNSTTVAMVTADGLVTGLRDGDVSIIAKNGDQSASLVVHVRNNLYITRDGSKITSLSLANGENVTLSTNATSTPSWSSSNTSVVTVSNGVLTSKGLGSATVTASVGSLKASVDIEVYAGFRVAADKYVRFSPGNLQYQPSSQTWRFAPNQYDVIGTGNEGISSTSTTWMDLFAWGVYYSPLTSRSTDISNFVDWGTNAIKNGSQIDAANTWRTLTHDELLYLGEKRPNASQLVGCAKVNGVKGCMLLPDGWTLPSGCSFVPYSGTLVYNEYNASSWSKMEASGAVFLPAAGDASSTFKVYYVGTECSYWTSTRYRNLLDSSSDGAYLFEMNEKYQTFTFKATGNTYQKRSVRLVR